MKSWRGRFSALKLRRKARVLSVAKTAVLTGNSDAIRAQEKAFASFLKSEAHASEFTSIVAGRVDGDIAHSDATARLVELAPLISRNVSASALFALASLSQSVGCFSGSHPFEILARERHSATGARGALLGSIASRNIESAEELWSRYSPSKRHDERLEDIGHYLWKWSRGRFGTQTIITPTPWSELVGGADVLVIGPAPVTEIPPRPLNQYLVARVIAPGVTRWPDNSFEGRCDLAYANNKSTKWFLSQGDADLFAAYRYTSFRTDRWHPLGIGNGRTAFTHKELLPMPWDKTNMVPMIIWDVLKAGAKSIHVSGANFFASQLAYTRHEARFKPEEKASTNESGSTGKRFERCVSFSNHALTRHLAMVANLVSSRSITMDSEGNSVTMMADDSYLALIDGLYGNREI